MRGKQKREAYYCWDGENFEMTYTERYLKRIEELEAGIKAATIHVGNEKVREYLKNILNKVLDDSLGEKDQAIKERDEALERLNQTRTEAMEIIMRVTKERDAYRDIAILERTERMNYGRERSLKPTFQVVDEEAKRLKEEEK